MLGTLSLMVALFIVTVSPYRAHALVSDLLQTTTSSLRQVVVTDSQKTFQPQPSVAVPSQQRSQSSSQGASSEQVQTFNTPASGSVLTTPHTQEVVTGEPLVVDLQPLEFQQVADYSITGVSPIAPIVKTASLSKDSAAITTSESGWRLFNLAWYWWVALISVVTVIALTVKRKLYQQIQRRFIHRNSTVYVKQNV
jgi:hypothetical protein